MEKYRLKLTEKIKKVSSVTRYELTVLHLCLIHPRTPKKARILLAFALAYAASPVDLVPDFIPILGHLDDAVLIPVLIIISYRMVPKEIIDECRKQAETAVYSPSKNLLAAGIIILIYICIIGLITWAVIK